MPREINTWKDWAEMAVEKHGWKKTFEIALRHVNGCPQFFGPVVEHIKKTAPAGALADVLGQQ